MNLFDRYKDGYWKAIVDLKNFIERVDDRTKSKKQYKEYILSLLNTLATDQLSLEPFIDYGGDVWIQASADNKIVKIRASKAELKE